MALSNRAQMAIADNGLNDAAIGIAQVQTTAEGI
jgi:hypothetical protein